MKRNRVHALLASLTIVALVASDVALLTGASAQSSQIPGYGTLGSGTSPAPGTGGGGGGGGVPSFTMPNYSPGYPSFGGDVPMMGRTAPAPYVAPQLRPPVSCQANG